MYHKIAAILFDKLLDELYPIRLGLVEEKGWNVDALYDELVVALNNNLIKSSGNNRGIAKKFFEEIPQLKEKLDLDVKTIMAGDPAAKSEIEIILTYPGFYAIAAYRVANLLHELGVELIPRLITEHAHSSTGIDIHPGAKIGKGFFIDHGTGIVVGETTVIGDNVKLYQGVTLGALSPRAAKLSEKRHPTIQDNVVLYAQATILGGETVIGEGSIIGGNVWLTSGVPSYSKVYYEATVEKLGRTIEPSKSEAIK
ncbi:MAG: serine acetyltransferase [Crocinitomicaceae bacterium]|nr:serine acetyltransferase [Crocinitomicaceae bacterium]